MKQLITLSIILLCSFRAFSCTCDPAYENRGFCQVIHGSQNNPMFCVVKGRIISWYEYGAYVEVLDNIYGQASGDTILMWGDMGACCRPSFAGFAQILPDDTLVMALEQTDLCGNWIAPGLPDFEDTNDYVLQGCGAYFMRIHNGQVTGYFDSSNNLSDTMEYSAFVSQVQNCITPATVQKVGQSKTISVYPNPAGDLLFINSASPVGELRLFNSVGHCIFQSAGNEATASVDLSKLPPGIYTLLIYDKEKELIMKQKVMHK
jgi:hypothetical protein